MSKKRAAGSRSKAFSRLSLFGPPPLLEGEDSEAYDVLLARVSGVVGPTDFIEEIWVRDIVDVTWTLFRLRRIQAAFLSAKVSDDADDEAESLAKADPKLLEGTKEQQDEMIGLLDSERRWETRVAKYPRANEKFQKLWASARSTLNIDAIQANIMVHEIDVIERIEHLIMLAERRLDVVIREIDRHRIMQTQRDNNIEKPELKLLIQK
jgi:hypothetical protein